MTNPIPVPATKITRMTQRTGSAALWASSNTILAKGEIGFELDTNRYKIGNGSSHWNDLAYFTNSEDTQQFILDSIPNGVNTTIIAGNAITKDYDENAGTVTIGVDQSVLEETTRDAIGTALTAGSGITITPNDNADTITVEVTANTYDSYGAASTAESNAKTYADNLTSDDMVEGSVNKYFTDERAQDAVGNYVGTGLTYTDATGEIKVTPNTYDAYGSAATAESNASSALTSHENDTTNIHGILDTSKLITTDGTQTLTNKTIYSPTLTGTTSTNNLIVDGDLTLNGGAFQASTTSIIIEDNIVQLAHQNPSNIVDLGIVVAYNDGSNKHSGIVRDVSENTWKLFKGVATEPANTVDFTQGTLDNLALNTLTGTVIGNVTGNVTGNITGNADTVTNGVYTTGTYSNPAWLTTLGWSKISGTPTTVSGYGITDAVATSGSYVNPSWITSLAASKVGLGNVENTALSTWAGSTNITTLGTIATGTWSGTAIALNKGGTGATTQAGAANAILPSQSTNSGKYLTTNGTDVSWGTVNSYSAPTIGTTSITSGGTFTTLPGVTSVNGTTIPSAKTLVITTDIGTSVQAWDADLDAIATLTGTSGFLTKTAANTWALDTSTYISASSPTISTATFTGTTTAQGALNVNTLSGATNPALKISGTVPTQTNSTTGVVQIGSALTASDSGNMLTMSQNTNNYIQATIQNQSAGSAASADFIVINQDTSTGNSGIYGDFGINSSGWTGTSPTAPFDIANGTYLAGYGGVLTVGTPNANSLLLASNNTTRITIDSTGVITLATAPVITGGTSSGFLKANGTIDTTTYGTSNYTAPTIGTTSITSGGTFTTLPGVTSVNGTTIPSAATLLTSTSTSSALTSFGSSPTLTTPTIDTINTSLTTTGTAALWNTGLTTGTLSIGGAVTGGTINIGAGTPATPVTKTINIGTGQTNGLSVVNIGAVAGGTSTVGLNGAVTTSAGVTTGGNIAINAASPTISSNNASAASIFTSTVTGVTIGASTIKTTAYPSAPSGTTTGTVTTSAQSGGYLGIPVNAQGSAGVALAYTLVASDAGKMIYVNSTPTTPTITIPANSAVAFEIGTTIVITNDIGAATNVSIAITTDTLQLAGAGTTGTRTLAQYGIATLTKVTATKWIISGNGLT